LIKKVSGKRHMQWYRPDRYTSIYTHPTSIVFSAFLSHLDKKLEINNKQIFCISFLFVHSPYWFYQW